ncbi:MAG: TIGR01244 family sulfur transferase [Erythrobacter sp.]
MNDFRKLSDRVFASPQIAPEDIAAAKGAGVTLIVNNRPDGEDPGAPQGGEIAAAAHSAGLDYRAIPIGHSGFSEAQVAEMVEALDGAGGKVLAYCRSGTRSTFLWALAQARTGAATPEEIAAAAREAGYDVSPIRPMIDMLAAR